VTVTLNIILNQHSAKVGSSQSSDFRLPPPAVVRTSEAIRLPLDVLLTIPSPYLDLELNFCLVALFISSYFALFEA
jgi:hypothetical protein